MPSKNLFFVPLIGMEVPGELFNKYWAEVEAQVGRLETIYGNIKKLYHEANYLKGEEGIRLIQRINEKSYQLFKNRIDKGSELQDLENKEVLWEIADCQLFLTFRFSSKSVLERVSKLTPELVELYKSAMKTRNAYIPKQICDTLKEGETGVLVLREEERIKMQFPPEINLILVRPPILTDIEKWTSDQESKDNENQGH